MKKLLGITGFLMIMLMATPVLTFAQCPMCKTAAETSLQKGDNTAKNLNRGILYLFATPYLVVGTIGFVWWRNKKKVEQGGSIA